MALPDPLIPANAGTQITGRCGPAKDALQPFPSAFGPPIWVPAFAGMSGSAPRAR